MNDTNVSLSVFVPGIPQSRGSKRAFPFRRTNGQLGVAVSDDNPSSRDWMAIVSDVVGRAMDGRPPLEGPVFLDLLFRMPRPQYHYRTGRNAGELKADAPQRHTKKPDRGKLARAVEDALTGVVYRDDSQVWGGVITKVYGDQPGVLIGISGV